MANKVWAKVVDVAPVSSTQFQLFIKWLHFGTGNNNSFYGVLNATSLDGLLGLLPTYYSDIGTLIKADMAKPGNGSITLAAGETIYVDGQ